MNQSYTLCVLLLFMLRHLFCQGIPNVHPLPVVVESLSGHGAVVSMSGVLSSGKCSITYHQVNSTEVSVKLDYTPQLHNYTIELNQLEPNTVYDIYLFCEENGTKYHSALVTFKTVEKGYTLNLTNKAKDSSTPSSQDRNLDTFRIQDESTDDKLNPVDVAMGILFGTVGVGIIGAVSYYIFKKISHQRRLQRFRQYRQHQNDSLPDLEQNDTRSHV